MKNVEELSILVEKLYEEITLYLEKEGIQYQEEECPIR